MFNVKVVVSAMVLFLSSAWGETVENPHLRNATTHLKEFDLSRALAELDLALTLGNTRTNLLTIYELQGSTAATLGDESRARKAFTHLLVLDPTFKLPDRYGPRVRTPFYEARAEVREALTPIAEPPEYRDGKVTRLRVRVAVDPLGMVQMARFHVLSADGTWADTEVPVTDKVASVAVNADEVTWWAQLIGDNGTELMTLGKETEPLKAARMAMPGLASEVTRTVKSEKAAVRTSLKPWAYSAGIAGVVAGAAGAYFGLQFIDARNKLGTLEVDPNNRVLNMTQVEAFEIEKRAKSHAWTADALFVAGGVLAATGVTLWIVDSVAVTPAATGVVVGGTF